MSDAICQNVLSVRLGQVDRKNRHLQEGLVQCSTYEAAGALLNAARIRNDNRALLELGGPVDTSAKEVLYHRSCYQVYHLNKELSRITDDLVECETHTIRWAGRSICFCGFN